MIEEFHFRAANTNDSGFLYSWRNDSVTRLNSKNPEPVSQENHEKWFQESLVNTNRKIMIIVAGIAESETRIGVIRSDYNPQIKSYELSWNIAPEARGKGWGKRALKKFVETYPGTYTAIIKNSNEGSQSIARAAGFSLDSKEADFGVWVCNTLNKNGQVVS